MVQWLCLDLLIHHHHHHLLLHNHHHLLRLLLRACPPPPLNHHHGLLSFLWGVGHFPHSFCLKKVRDIDPYGIRVLSVPEKQAADSWFLGYEWQPPLPTPFLPSFFKKKEIFFFLFFSFECTALSTQDGRDEAPHQACLLSRSHSPSILSMLTCAILMPYHRIPAGTRGRLWSAKGAATSLIWVGNSQRTACLALHPTLITFTYVHTLPHMYARARPCPCRCVRVRVRATLRNTRVSLPFHRS